MVGTNFKVTQAEKGLPFKVDPDLNWVLVFCILILGGTDALLNSYIDDGWAFGRGFHSL